VSLVEVVSPESSASDPGALSRGTQLPGTLSRATQLRATLDRPRVSVVIPAINEEQNLPYVLTRISPDVFEVVLVDGESTDNTCEVARSLWPGVRIVKQEGRGKGAALRSGFAAATGDIIVMLDGDGSTDPAELPAFVGALLAGADVAKGSRFIQGAGTVDMPLYRKIGNRAFVVMVRILFGGQYSDLCYGYNAFWRSALARLDLDGDGFEIETMMNIRALRAGMRVVEVSSFEDKRHYGESHLRTVPDGWRVFKTILREHRAAARKVRDRRTVDGVAPVAVSASDGVQLISGRDPL
jgi:glycosyltransferase involved in cell wall biosynthesis